MNLTKRSFNENSHLFNNCKRQKRSNSSVPSLITSSLSSSANSSPEVLFNPNIYENGNIIPLDLNTLTLNCNKNADQTFTLHNNFYSSTSNFVKEDLNINLKSINTTSMYKILQNSIEYEEELDSDFAEGTELKARQNVRSSIKQNKKLTADFTIKILLGWGSNGAVLGALDRNNKPVAIKIVYKTNDRFRNGETGTKDLPKEIAILKNLDPAENILNFIEYFEDSLAFYIVTERVIADWSEENENREPSDEIQQYDNVMTIKILHTFPPYLMKIPVRSGPSDLFSFLNNINSISEKNIKYIFKQIVLGVSKLHSSGIVHKDLKEENILLSSNLQVKIADFGHASKKKFLSDNKNLISNKDFNNNVYYYGSIHMSPPELLANTNRNVLVGFSGFEADCWALGLILYSLVTLTIEDENREKFINSVKENKFRGKYYPCKWNLIKDVNLKNLLKGLLIADPKKRFGIVDVINALWIN
ncbi:hypothetical protein HK099_001035 [Clydaea vesicula]|uniref:Protein kinase domain-containing protein n=1 Tax=Clydaea vesicula TaxID=447962 RepID=A0AAD5U5A5_9FUNG|nr:hypothetical protein HK099_001035 [Clydaea vesicula]